MIHQLELLMRPSDYSHFISDYNSLYTFKSDKELWGYALSQINIGYNKMPLFKAYFDKLSSPYSYYEYKRAIEQNPSIHSIIFGHNNREKNSQSVIDSLHLYYTTETYIGFIVEHLLYENIKSLSNKRITKNKILDTKKKTDILYNGFHFQIKNKSFLLSKRILEYVNYYTEVNPVLYFIFYTIEKDNIYFITLGGSPFIHLKNIDGFTLLSKEATATPIKEYTSKLIAAAV